MKEQLAELLKILTESIQQGKDLASSQAPELFQQLVQYQIVTGCYRALIGLLLCVPAYFLGRRALQAYRKSNDVDDAIGWFASTLMTAGVALPMFFVNVHTTLYWWLAPKVATIEYLASLVK